MDTNEHEGTKLILEDEVCQLVSCAMEFSMRLQSGRSISGFSIRVY